LPFMLNCCMTFVGVSGTGLGKPGRGVWHSSMDMDILAVWRRDLDWNGECVVQRLQKILRQDFGSQLRMYRNIDAPQSMARRHRVDVCGGPFSEPGRRITASGIPVSLA
jgi:hypothetical protein